LFENRRPATDIVAGLFIVRGAGASGTSRSEKLLNVMAAIFIRKARNGFHCDHRFNMARLAFRLVLLGEADAG
jgi:hypothetical protein